MSELVVDRVLELPDGSTVTAVARRRVHVHSGPAGALVAASLAPAALIVRRGSETVVHSLEAKTHTLESLSARLAELES